MIILYCIITFMKMEVFFQKNQNFFVKTPNAAETIPEIRLSLLQTAYDMRGIDKY